MRLVSTMMAVLSLCLASSAALAQEVKLGNLTIEQAWSRATPNGAQVAAGYLEVVNNGDSDDKLVAATSDIAGMAGIHEMSMDSNGVMKMGEVKGGLVIPAHQTVKLEPHGFHIMFMDLKHGLKQGDKFQVDLTFEKAGKASVEFVAGAIDASSAPAE
jgi:copper(I)-binding protein